MKQRRLFPVPSCQSTIEIFSNEKQEWSSCDVMTPVDLHGRCRCLVKDDTGVQIVRKLMFSPRKFSKIPAVVWRRALHTTPRSAKAHKNLSKLHKTPQILLPVIGFDVLLREQVNIMVRQLTNVFTHSDNFTPMTISKTMESNGIGFISKNERITHASSWVVKLHHSHPFYSMCKMVYYTFIESCTDEIMGRKFLTSPHIVLSLSGSSMRGIKHTDNYNIDETMNVVWCGYFLPRKGIIEKPFKFLSVNGETKTTLNVPFAFDAKQNPHHVIFDPDAPKASIRVSVVFFHNQRKPMDKRVIYKDV